jgi:large subunit ribosomal protein L23
MALFGNKKTGQKDQPATKAAAKKTAEKSAAPVSMQDLYSAAAETPKVKTNKKAAETGAKSGAAHRILVQPLITEKATNLNGLNKYAFIVSERANKIEVAKAIQAVYGVKPVKVNLLNVQGKRVARGQIRGQRSDWRKAIVTLPQGETIKIYEGV